MTQENFKKLDLNQKRAILLSIANELKDQVLDWHIENVFEDKGFDLIDKALELPNELEEGSPQDNYRFETYKELKDELYKITEDCFVGGNE
ncbi:hypothetical protein [uncultured phage_MedDCM-OCT-S28-C10]|uniref:Uncharacterized protein n=1 Tax=uncultured phage_MedDCM-OCT-S28-C10 TaxID=2741077 RepID=A0A6S4PDG2_9CAUD|nr:hypothetical protein HOQ60_gp25 [uncultured phage_MedDCM-OCT-S28-C10]BAQ94068.1 hypothetical protein [uncultured phage_MedDCM-OCT-S28-C10]BAR25270.1 hypothetical protein [uncultured Mediterranean phage uvMED]BAR25319.1 hypothetical protein [uncultured Mediterranean phage uvMED]